MAIGGAYKKRWDSWLLQRVTGHYTGRTDEIFQWAACKWGISDNVLRAIAVRELGSSNAWKRTYLAVESGSHRAMGSASATPVDSATPDQP